MTLKQSDLYNYAVKTIDGQDITLEKYEGKVLLIVNVASRCGLTPQYTALEKVYEQYHGQGFEILGFPANEFGAQEPGTNEEIQQFCSLNYNVQFPLFSKIVVKGDGQHPLYHYLTNVRPVANERPGSPLKSSLAKHGLLNGADKDITWNFEKFLVNRHGEVVARFSPDVTPEDPMLISALKAELAK
jgi:glutathione peroxidase